MSRSAGSIVFAVGIALVAVAMTVTALDFNPEARTAPLLIGIPTSLIAIIMVIRDVLRLRGGDSSVGAAADEERDRYASADEGQSATATETTTGTEVQRIEAASTLSAVLWVIGLIGLIWIFGLLLAGFIFVLSFMKVFAHERWVTSVAYAIGTTVVIYFLFGELLDQTLYEGMLGGILPL